ncbi:MAG: substrate-binding domain-containing protein [Faecalibacterium sp.]|jgi:simple sugar transport system substrate-binding protein|nr:substrate-binding domain-containing protein [Faecalibacterium sp.]
MKRMICALLAVALLSGCAAHTAAAAAAVSAPEDPIVVGYCQTGAESDWRVANTESMKSAFSEENGYELIYCDAQNKQENQIRDIRRLIQQQVDYIVLSPITEDGWDEVLQEAKDAHIPVIITDRFVHVSDASLYAAYVGSDFRKEGDTAMQWLDTYLTGYGRTGETIHIVELQGTLDSTAQLGRTAGLEAAVEKHTNWALDRQVCADFTTAKATEVMRQVLAQGQPIDVLICQNDNMALGAMQALDEAGVSYGGKNGMLLISFDATNAGLTACLAGKIALDVECNPLQGPYAEAIVRQLEAGEQPEKELYVDETSFDFRAITQALIDSRLY